MAKSTSYFGSVAGPALHPIDELPAFAAVADEILANAQAGRPRSADPSLVAKPIDADAVWANYNKGGKGTPTSASTLPRQELTESAIKRRLGA